MLMQACALGRFDVVKKLVMSFVTSSDSSLSETLNTNASDIEGWTALMFACKVGSRQIVEELLSLSGDMYVDVNARSERGLTALMIAAAAGHKHVVECLTSAHNPGSTPATNIDITAMVMHDDHFQDTETKTASERTQSLEHAASRLPKIRQSEESTLSRLELSAVDAEGRTALHHALLSGHANVGTFLVHKGLDMEQVDNQGKTVCILCMCVVVLFRVEVGLCGVWCTAYRTRW